MISGVPPLHLFIREQLLQSANRNSVHIEDLLVKHPYKNTYIKRLKKELQMVGVTVKSASKDRMPKMRIGERNYELDIASFDN